MNMLKFTLSSILLTTALCLSAQTDSTLFIGARDTTTVGTMNMDAVKNRPLMRLGQIPVNVGGYASVKAEHLGEDGITDGLSFSMQRFTLFLSSTISERVSFATEIEFEEGAEEIGIEFAAIDLEFSQLVNLRAGIVMNPIGRFNENHDDPRWDFVDRPISATQLLPATWSNVGFGLYGRKRVGSFNLGYEAYLTNGFNDAIISNADARTSLPASKEDPGRFGESSNGVPMFTARLAAQHPRWGEIGISHMGGVYNKFANDGEIVDDRRRVDVFAVDGTCTINPLRTTITGEFACWMWCALS